MLVAHAKTAQSMGIPADNCLIIENGDVVELKPDSIRKGDPVKAGIELLDASRNGIVDARVLKERQQLAEDGVITLLAVISTDGVMAAPPRVNLRGVVTTADARKMSLWAEREIGWVLENRWNQLSRNSGGAAPDVDWMGVQREIEVGLQRRLRRELQVEPLIICLVQPAPGGTPAYKGRADAEPDSRPAPRGGRREGGRDGGRELSREVNRDVNRDVTRDVNRDRPAPVAGATAVAQPAAPAQAPAAAQPQRQRVAVAAAEAPIEDPELAATRTRRRRSGAAG